MSELTTEVVTVMSDKKIESDASGIRVNSNSDFADTQLVSLDKFISEDRNEFKQVPDIDSEEEIEASYQRYLIQKSNRLTASKYVSQLQTQCSRFNRPNKLRTKKTVSIQEEAILAELKDLGVEEYMQKGLIKPESNSTLSSPRKSILKSQSSIRQMSTERR